MDEPEILDSNLASEKVTTRRQLLPWWIKVFVWIFMIFGVLVPLGLISGILGFPLQLALYGLETTEPLSMTGLVVTGLFLFKGIVAFALWMEKEWAVTAGQADAIIGIAVCIFVMLFYPFINGHVFKLNIRLELILLIPYLIKLNRIKSVWIEKAVAGNAG